MQLKISAMKKDIFKCVIKKFLSFLLVCMNVYCFPLLFVHFDRYKTNMRIFYIFPQMNNLKKILQMVVDYYNEVWSM